ncbi:hypothetical protein [Geomonas ferrireducens]|uniref:hypothetical protein n=1 Tax=Geomonas ferrireducens TaxID=2570227 RepID=UPI0010A8D850|nr:hypothetical protein [Geomonas ferrireducens]
MVEKSIEQVTMTIKEAVERHKGVTARQFRKLCLRGKYLAKIHGGASRVPAKELNTALFAKKWGRDWQIPVAELDRLFLPTENYR